jgi:hypothetical protein
MGAITAASQSPVAASVEDSGVAIECWQRLRRRFNNSFFFARQVSPNAPRA